MSKIKYVGPLLSDLMKPATWATTPLPRAANQEGRRQRGQAGFQIVPAFAKQFVYIGKLGAFADRADPRTLYDEKPFNNAMRHFSDVIDTAALMHKMLSVKVDGVGYDPASPNGVYTSKGKRLFNIHIGSGIKAAKGDPRPFLRYLRQVIPNRSDRRHVEQFIATLLAMPDTRVLYGLLLWSKVQGVGKSTLADHILRPLLGPHNCSSTSAKDITGSAFNSWIAERRLIIVDEVYAGHSAELANTIKPLITGETVTVNRKFKEPYDVDNCAHFILMSNSPTPIFVEQTDRRWLVPEVSEILRPKKYWREFRRWLKNGGLAIIQNWAECYVRSKKRGPVLAGSHAPSTAAKDRLIEGSIMGGGKLIRELSEYLINHPRKVILPIKVLKQWVRDHEELSTNDKKMPERAMLGELLPGINIFAGDKRCDNGKRKFTAITNFDKTAEDKWPDLCKDGGLWDLARLKGEFDAL